MVPAGANTNLLSQKLETGVTCCTHEPSLSATHPPTHAFLVEDIQVGFGLGQPGRRPFLQRSLREPCKLRSVIHVASKPRPQKKGKDPSSRTHWSWVVDTPNHLLKRLSMEAPGPGVWVWVVTWRVGTLVAYSRPFRALGAPAWPTVSGALTGLWELSHVPVPYLVAYQVEGGGPAPWICFILVTLGVKKCVHYIERERETRRIFESCHTQTLVAELRHIRVPSSGFVHASACHPPSAMTPLPPGLPWLITGFRRGNEEQGRGPMPVQYLQTSPDVAQKDRSDTPSTSTRLYRSPLEAFADLNVASRDLLEGASRSMSSALEPSG